MSYNPTFIWERNREGLRMHPDRNYLFYYRGCFCPPHIGHFEDAAKYLKYPNVRMIIHQMGGSRHGVPRTVNRKIWNWYIDELLPQDKIDLVQYNNETRRFPRDHPWLKDSDVIIIMRGDEVETDLKSYERLDYHRWGFVIKNARQYNIDVVFLYHLRYHESISATAFTDSLINYKQGKHPIDEVYKFLPHKLSLTTKNKIIYLLSQCHLK